MKSVMRTAVMTAADDLLGQLGLMRRHTLLRAGPAAAWFAAGAVCGGCVALILTPMSGEELLGEVEKRLQRARERLRKGVRADKSERGERPQRSMHKDMNA